MKNRIPNYRAWDFRAQSMHNVLEIKTAYSLIICQGKGILDPPFSLGFNEFALMESTGLKKDKKDGKLGKAKHGQMIFEGDVFRQEVETDLGDRTEYSVVTWIDCRAAFYLVNTYHYLHVIDNQDNPKFHEDPSYSWLFEDAALYDFSLDVGLPLVGNIYENPELLEA